MLKWYQKTEESHDVFVAERVRLVRNLAHEPFPVKLSEEEGKALLGRMERGMETLRDETGAAFSVLEMPELGDTEKQALKERRAINGAGAMKKGPERLLLSADESESLLLNGEDHIRIQCIGSGTGLEALWKEADRLDDAVNEQFPYAFHEKYGYLTAYPTNVGTGLRAGVTLHLPLLSVGKQFGKLVNEIGRFGVSVRGLYGDGAENYGALYEVSNQKTLGVSEAEILSLVQQMADRLAGNERKMKTMTLKNHRLDMEDEVFKSYGVLKYAKKLSVKEAMIYLSQVRVGETEGLLEFRSPMNFYGLMLEIQQANLELLAPEADRGDLKKARADHIRKRLPELV